MRVPSFQQWQSRQDATRQHAPLTVVVVEYQADGNGVERVRATLPPAGPERHPRGSAARSSRRDAR